MGRNYTVFALLADVRNGYGLDPIVDPRGLPKDVSKEIKDESDEWGVDGHSHSHLTLKELMVAKSRQYQITKCGIVDMFNYIEYLENGQPSCWCGMISGPGIHIVNNEKMNEALKTATNEQKSKEFYSTTKTRYYTHIDWEVEANMELSHFFKHVLPQLEPLSESTAHDDVRIVFWFDS